MLDSRIIDLSLNKVFIKLILGEEVPLTMATLKVYHIMLSGTFRLNLQLAC
jgi:E3 ubiquitin-protein ligase TRIP12